MGFDLTSKSWWDHEIKLELCAKTQENYFYIHQNLGGAQSIPKPHANEFPYSISYLKDSQSNGETLSLTHSSLVLRKLFQKVKFLYFILPMHL